MRGGALRLFLYRIVRGLRFWAGPIASHTLFLLFISG